MTLMTMERTTPPEQQVIIVAISDGNSPVPLNTPKEIPFL